MDCDQFTENYFFWEMKNAPYLKHNIFNFHSIYFINAYALHIY